MTSQINYDAATGKTTVESVAVPAFVEPRDPQPTDTEVLDELIDLLVAQGVITNV